MRGILILALAFFVAFGAQGGERVLHIYTWADYFDSRALDQFQKKYDCSVVLDIFDSNEVLFKTLQVDRGSFDVLTPSSYMAGILDRNGYLADLDHSLLPNLEHLTPDAADMGEDGAMRFSVPYTRTTTGIGYNKKYVPESLRGSWKIFDNAAAIGKGALLTDMRECLGAALKLLGYSLNSTDPDEIREAGEVVRRWRRGVEMHDSEAGKAGLVDGKFVFVQNYNGDMLQAMMDDGDLGFFVPGEGSSVTTDEFAIAADSPMKELAHAFINHMLDPDVARLNMESIFYYMPNATALENLPEEIRGSPAFSIDPDALGKSEVIREVGDANAIYERVWEEVFR